MKESWNDLVDFFYGYSAQKIENEIVNQAKFTSWRPFVFIHLLYSLLSSENFE